MKQSSSNSYVGVDVSKDQLDIAVGQEGEIWQAGNDTAGILQTVKRLQAICPALIVIESTGGLEVPLMAELSSAGLTFALVHPGRVRDFARSLGQLAKTDKLDARLLARFGEAVQPKPTQLPSQDIQALNGLMVRRKQLNDMLVMERNHLRTTILTLRPSVEVHITGLEEELAKIDRKIEEKVQQIPEFQEKRAILCSAKGVGPVISAKLLSGLPELGTLSSKKIAALVGLAPFNDDSGHRRGKRRIKGGREDVRSVLYMGAVAAARSNPVIKPFYQSLLKRGKLKKVAIIACEHKFLTILNAMVRDMKPFHSPLPGSTS